MITRDDIHQKAGETLSLAQRLEVALTIPIMMLFLLKSGHGKDLSEQDVRKIFADKGRETQFLKSKIVDAKFRQDMMLEIGSIVMLVRNGTMGALNDELQKYLRVSPGGPAASLGVLKNALEDRNYLCHEFFKEVGADIGQDQAVERAALELDRIQDNFRAAISFCDRLTEALRQEFPKTFGTETGQIH